GHGHAGVGHVGRPGRTGRLLSALGGIDEAEHVGRRRHRARQDAVRDQGRVRELSSRQQRRLPPRSGLEQRRTASPRGGARDLARRSQQGNPLHEPPVPRRDEGRPDGDRAPAESRHVQRPAARQQRAAAFVREDQPPRLRVHRGLADAVVQREVQRPGARRRGQLPGVAEGQGRAMKRVLMIAAVCACAVTLRAQQVTFDRILHPEKEPQNWLSYSQNLFNQRFSPLTQITPGNAKNLELQWVWQSKSLEKFEATALVVDGVLYTLQGPPAQGVYEVVALDAASGRPFWTLEYKPMLEARPCCGRVSRGLAILGDTLYMGTIDAHLVAIDAKTGKIIWDHTVEKVGDKPIEKFAITHAPVVIKDKIVVGIAGGDLGVRGFICAFDAKTGKELW